jgi:hypothetical protein
MYKISSSLIWQWFFFIKKDAIMHLLLKNAKNIFLNEI